MSIFVSLASYRDRDCKNTLTNLFEMADAPERVFVGACEQNDPADQAEEQCQPGPHDPKYAAQVRTIRMHHTDARGPCYARYLCSTLYGGEKYYLQIDSHMRFVRGWDSKLISELTQIQRTTGNPRIVLSTYVRSVDDYQRQLAGQLEPHAPHLCQAFWNADGIPSLHGAHLLDSHGEARLTAFVAGGLMFLESRPFLDLVPYDPELRDIFVGEEILHSARLWTNGYDIYGPSQNIAFHKFTREAEPKFWDNERDPSTATQRVKYLLGLQKDPPPGPRRGLERYSMGNARSLDDYYRFAGIRKSDMRVTRNFCGGPPIPDPPDGIHGLGIFQGRTTRLVTRACHLGAWLVLAAYVILLVLVLNTDQ